MLEKLDVKQELFARIEKLVQPHTIVASNTSGLCIQDMLQGRTGPFKESFLVMHFFNPVRYMKLLEIVVGPDTSKETLARVTAFGEDVLGKGIVEGKDTPNFVANRIGTHAMLVGIHQMLADKLVPEDVDAITGVPMGHPKSASFRTADMVGLDTFVHVADHCYAALGHDEEREVFKVPAFIRTMVEKKLLGDKTKGGFYKKGPDGQIETFDLETGKYRPKGGDESVMKVTKSISKIEDPKERLRKLCADQGKAGKFAWKVLSRSFAYSARRIGAEGGGEIADSVVAIDDAMRWGYNWELGPFEVWDALGFAETTDRILADGIKLPESVRKMRASGAKGFYAAGEVHDLQKGTYVKRPTDPRNATFDILRKGEAPVLKNGGAEAWDLGDGVLGLTFKTKANSIDPDVISMITRSVEKAEESFRALVVSNSGEYFCVGANLFLVAMAAGQKEWGQIKTLVGGYQSAVQRMKYSRVPVVVAPYNMTLGGGLELCYGAASLQAAAETYAGLVEVGVGLIPGGRWDDEHAVACARRRSRRDGRRLARARNADVQEHRDGEGRDERRRGSELRLLPPDRRCQLRPRASAHRGEGAGARARRRRAITRQCRAPTCCPATAASRRCTPLVDALIAGGYASEHDAKIARKLAVVLCGGKGGGAHEVTEDEMLELEREAFVSLCGEPKSQERMQYMLMNNKPLRN